VVYGKRVHVCDDSGVLYSRLDAHGANDVLHNDGVLAYSGTGADERFIAIQCEGVVVSGVGVHGDVA
jgi:hypothetical protein